MIRYLLIAVCTFGCVSEETSRQTLNARTASAQVNDELNVRVHGGSLITFKELATTPPGEIPLVNVRAQSLDVRVDVRLDGCLPEVLHFTVSHLQTKTPQTTIRSFLDALDASTQATERVLAAGARLDADPHDPAWTALGNENVLPFLRDAGPPEALNWTLCVNRATRMVVAHEGHVEREVCGFPDSFGACAEVSNERDNDLEAATLVVRHRLRNELPSEYQFAVWGNNVSEPDIQARIIEAVNASNAQFAVINGDLTAEGTTPELVDSVIQLDNELNVPWFATLGDRDIEGSAGFDYIGLIGSSSFAFDAGPARIVVLDSADRAIGGESRAQLRDWLNGSPIGWSDTAPNATLMITHVPPFGAYGTRNLAMKDRAEAASLAATLRRQNVLYTLTSQLSRYLLQNEGGIRVVHSGGAGAPLESSTTSTHHWLLVTLESPCDPQSTDAVDCVDPSDASSCVCARLERRDL